MSKRRADKTKYWVKPPDGDPHQTGTWRPYGPLTLHEIASMLDWECEVMKEGRSLVTMKDSSEWLPLSAICPKKPKEIFTDEDMFWRNWWLTRAGKKFVPKPKVAAPQPVVPASNVQPVQLSRFQPAIKPQPQASTRVNAPSVLAVAGAVGVWQRQQMLSALRELNHTSHDIHQDLSNLNDSLSAGSDFGGFS